MNKKTSPEKKELLKGSFDREENNPIILEESGKFPLIVEINIPDNVLKPINQRIFCVSQDPGELKTKGGIIVPTNFSKETAQNESQRKSILRYFVVDVAKDCTIKFTPEGEKKCRFLRKGDEIAIFYPESMIGYDHSTVFDFAISERYITFHQTEIAGVVTKSALIVKEKD